MPQLPDHPDLAQLRRQARELLRAAAGATPCPARDGRSRRRPPCSTAQLALAREYGFPSWPRLKDEAERRRAQAGEAGQAGGARSGASATPIT